MIAVEVTAHKDSIPIEHMCKQMTDHTGMEDIMTAGKTRVRVEVGETVGGPHFSSVRVHVAIEIPCEYQNVQKASNALYEKSLELLDSYIGPTYKGLLRHLETLHMDEE